MTEFKFDCSLRLICGIILLTILGVVSKVGAQEAGVYELTQQGWEISDHSERREIQAGEAPYEKLTRVISVSEYHLEKGEEKIICWISYDSQKDTQTEDCQKQ